MINITRKLKAVRKMSLNLDIKDVLETPSSLLVFYNLHEDEYSKVRNVLEVSEPVEPANCQQK